MGIGFAGSSYNVYHGNFRLQTTGEKAFNVFSTTLLGPVIVPFSWLFLLVAGALEPFLLR